MSYKDQTIEEWEAAIEEVEKKCYKRDEARDLYNQGKLTNGQLFCIEGGQLEDGTEPWIVATFMNGRMMYAKYRKDDQRIDTLKAKGIAYLLDVVKERWTDTKQAPWLPSRIQNIDNPDLIIHGAKSGESIKKVLNDGKEKIVVKEEEKVLSEMEDIAVDIA